MAHHRTEHRVRFHELDPYDHVNHAIYVTYFEIGRVDALAAVELGLTALKEVGYQLVVVISTGVSDFGRASTVWSQEIHRGGDRIASGTVTAAITDTDGRPTRPPTWIFERLEALRVDRSS